VTTVNVVIGSGSIGQAVAPRVSTGTRTRSQSVGIRYGSWPRPCAGVNARARINTISPGIIMTPLANDELRGPSGAGYRRMIEGSAAGRAGTPDEVGHGGALLMGPDGAFITGSDFLMDGGVTAAYWFGDLAP